MLASGTYSSHQSLFGSQPVISWLNICSAQGPPLEKGPDCASMLR